MYHENEKKNKEINCCSVEALCNSVERYVCEFLDKLMVVLQCWRV